MDVTERQQYRFNILKKIYDELKGNYNETILDYKFVELFPKNEVKNILDILKYWNERGYISINRPKSIAVAGNEIKLTSQGIDHVEKPTADASTEKYQQDSSMTVINYGNMTNSPISNASFGASITITQNEGYEVLLYLQDLLKRNNNPALEIIVENTESKVKNNNATRDYFQNLGKALLNMGISITSNLLTPSVATLLGIV